MMPDGLGDETKDALKRIAETPDHDIDLAEAALVLATIDRPQVAPDAYRRHLAALADEVGAYASSQKSAREGGDDSVDDRIEALTQVIAKRYGYVGTDRDFEDLDAANLTRVIDARHGLPIAIGIIYIDVARKLGWSADGVDFPGRFLVQLDGEADRALIDPFDSGRKLEAPDLRNLLKAVMGLDAELSQSHYAPAENRVVLVRLQNNIKVRHLQADRIQEALDQLSIMLAFAPETSFLWREAGILYAKMENIRASVSALEHYLALDAPAGERRNAVSLLQDMKNRLN